MKNPPRGLDSPENRVTGGRGNGRALDRRAIGFVQAAGYAYQFGHASNSEFRVDADAPDRRGNFRRISAHPPI